MGGSDGLRGYMVQTMILLLDAVNGRDDWIAITPEPEHVSEKFDLLWELEVGRSKATQVKSSRNRINLSDAKEWANSLKSKGGADEFELVLVGPVSEQLASTTDLDGVRVPTPKNWDPGGMLKQAAHGIDEFRDRRGWVPLRPPARLAIAESLAVSLSWDSIRSHRLTREDFEKRLVEWVSGIERGLSLKRMIITLEAPNDPSVVDAIMESLKQHAGDYSLSVSFVMVGSLRIHFECTAAGARRLLELRETGVIDRIEGFDVLSLVESPRTVPTWEAEWDTSRDLSALTLQRRMVHVRMPTSMALFKALSWEPPLESASAAAAATYELPHRHAVVSAWLDAARSSSFLGWLLEQIAGPALVIGSVPLVDLLLRGGLGSSGTTRLEVWSVGACVLALLIVTQERAWLSEQRRLLEPTEVLSHGVQSRLSVLSGWLLVGQMMSLVLVLLAPLAALFNGEIQNSRAIGFTIAGAIVGILIAIGAAVSRFAVRNTLMREAEKMSR